MRVPHPESRGVLLEALALHPAPGGALRYALETWPRLAARLKAEGRDLHVLLARSMDWSTEQQAAWRAAGVHLHFAEWNTVSPRTRWRHAGHNVRTTLQKCQRAGQPIGLLQTQGSVPLRGSFSGVGGPLRRVHLCHGVRPLRRGSRWKRWIAKRALQRCLMDVEACIAVSEFLREELWALSPSLDRRNTFVAPPGGDHADWTVAPGVETARRVFWLGPAAPHKGAITLAKACADLPREIPIVWSVNALEAQTLFAHSPGLRDRVQRVDPPPIDRPMPLPADALIVLPSELESFGLVVLEALSSGRPMVVSDLAAHREVVGAADQAVHWFAAGDEEQLRAAIVGALGSEAPEARDARQKRALDFRWDQTVEAIWQAWWPAQAASV